MPSIRHAAICWSPTGGPSLWIESPPWSAPWRACRYRLNLERAALRLSAATLARANRFAQASGVATIYGIRTPGTTIDEARSPRLEDLRRLRIGGEQARVAYGVAAPAGVVPGRTARGARTWPE